MKIVSDTLDMSLECLIYVRSFIRQLYHFRRCFFFDALPKISDILYDKSFCIWRIDPPNRSVTKHGQGKKLGGGKGTIDHYMYPVKRGRVIIEVGGNISFQEVSRMLQQISEKLPFPAKVVNQEMMENFEKEEEKLQVENVNKLRWEWAIKNNLLNCLTYAGKYDIEFSHLGPDCR